jgi:hypothetical protein
MPRTKSSKKNDTRRPLEKFNRIECKVELLMLYNYYNGLATNGALGFHVTPMSPFGSTKHRTGLFEIAFSKNQFRSKGKKLGQIANEFIATKTKPPDEGRPTITPEEINTLRERGKDLRSPAEKLDVIAGDVLERFVFYKYYDGYSTDGEVGFHLGAGPPGSINHKRAYSYVLDEWTESKFRHKGQNLAELAREFVELGLVPRADLRPAEPERQVPWGLIEEALALGGTYL